MTPAKKSFQGIRKTKNRDILKVENSISPSLFKNALYVWRCSRTIFDDNVQCVCWEKKHS